jgi:hypothetical protein
VIRILRLALEGMDPADAYRRVTRGEGRLSARELGLLSSGGKFLRSYCDEVAGGDFHALSQEEQLRLLQQVAHQASTPERT